MRILILNVHIFTKKNIYTTGKFLFSDLNYTLIHIRMLWELGAIVQ